MPVAPVTQPGLEATAPSGFFGKVPSRGDFVGRRVAPKFRDAFDSWLQAGILRSRAVLGDDWLPIYLRSPVWRFVVGWPVSTTDCWAGVLVPSVDKTGRYFPFAIISAPLRTRDLAFYLDAMDQWYVQAEALALGVLDAQFEVEPFDQVVAQLPLPNVPAGESIGPQVSVAVDGAAICYPLESLESLGEQYQAALQCGPAGQLGNASAWWSAGSQLMQPSLLFYHGLPVPRTYVAMLDGQWTQANVAIKRVNL